MKRKDNSKATFSIFRKAFRILASSLLVFAASNEPDFVSGQTLASEIRSSVQTKEQKSCQNQRQLEEQKLCKVTESVTVRIMRFSILSDNNDPLVLGSGVRLQPHGSELDRIVLTNRHVYFKRTSDLELPKDVMVATDRRGQTLDGEAFDQQKPRLIKVGQDLDIVMLEISDTQGGVSGGVSVGSSGRFKPNDKVCVGGFPGDNTGTKKFSFVCMKVLRLISPATASHWLKYQPIWTGESAEQGMSGGPVVDQAGLLVGLHTREKDEGPGIYTIEDGPDVRLGISSSSICSAFPEMKRYCENISTSENPSGSSTSDVKPDQKDSQATSPDKRVPSDGTSVHSIQNGAAVRALW